MADDTAQTPDSEPRRPPRGCATWRVEMYLAEQREAVWQQLMRKMKPPEPSPPPAAAEVAPDQRERYALHVVGQYPKEFERIGVPDTMTPGYGRTFTPYPPYWVNGVDMSAQLRPPARIYALPARQQQSPPGSGDTATPGEPGPAGD